MVDARVIGTNTSSAGSVRSTSDCPQLSSVHPSSWASHADLDTASSSRSARLIARHLIHKDVRGHHESNWAVGGRSLSSEQLDHQLGRRWDDLTR